MFFETTDFSIASISAFKLAWGANNSCSDIRPYHALSLRIKGNARFIHGNEIVEAKTNDIVFVPAFYQYRLDCAEENVCVIHFTSEEKLARRIKKFSPKTADFYKKDFDNLFNAYHKKQIGYEHECKHILYRILMHIERDIEHSKNGGNTEISRAIDYIHNNFTDPQLSVNFLAKCCNISETYFRKLFYLNLSVTPLEYINKLKLQYAVELLESKYYTVSEAAEKCGFANPYYFSSFIKKHTGYPPSKFITKS